jgi:flagellar M-ring protein FliF
MSLLFGSLDSKDAGEIASKLDAMSVPYELHGDGTQILVPSDQVLRLRMALAQDGLPGTSSVGYEIFDKSESFGTTSLVQNINMVRALEGELSRTISSLNTVAGARVHLVLPRRELFSRTEVVPTASIALKMRGSNRLSHQQVSAIQNLVSAAVPGLAADHIAIIDDKGNLLARSDGQGGQGGAMGGAADDYRIAFEERVNRSVQELLERIVGPGKARVEVNADIDLDRITTNAETYDPDGQVVRSTQTVEEKSESADKDNNQSVSVANNLPEAQQTGTAATTTKNSTGRTEETVNYEISKTLRTHIREGGSIKKISVAVLLDGTYAAAGDAAPTYTPRSDEELTKLTNLVKGAIGFDETRGDSVQLVNLQFAPVEVPGPIESAGFSMANLDLMKVLEIVVIGFVAILIILLVLRPLVSQLLNGHAAAVAQSGQPLAVTGPNPVAALPAPGAAQSANSAALQAPEEEDESEQLIDMAKVEGRVRRATIRKINEIVDKHPDEALNIVRGWLYAE